MSDRSPSERQCVILRVTESDWETTEGHCACLGLTAGTVKMDSGDDSNSDSDSPNQELVRKEAKEVVLSLWGCSKIVDSVH